MGLIKSIYNILAFFNYYYFPMVLPGKAKKVYFPAYQVPFEVEETKFLRLSAATFNYSSNYSDGYWQKPVYVSELSQVTLLGNSGALVQQNKVVSDSAFDQMRLCISPAYRSPALMWKRRKAGQYTSIFHLPWAHTSNYHWFYDCLPRIYALLQEVKDPINFIVNKDSPAFQLETLQFLIQDYPNFKIVYIGKNEKWEIEKYIFPAFVTNPSSGFLPPAIAELLRTKIWSGYQVQEQAHKTKIYISRSKASKRRILNEQALIQALLKLGFQVVYAEDLTYAQQVQLFYNTNVVIAPHGAGLTNILFSKECTVLELHPADMIKPHYFLASKALNFNYYYMIGSAANSNMDFEIDINQLLEKFTNIPNK